MTWTFTLGDDPHGQKYGGNDVRMQRKYPSPRHLNGLVHQVQVCRLCVREVWAGEESLGW